MRFVGPTLAGDTATMTYDKATTLELTAPIEGTNVALTDTSALRILNTTGTPVNQHGIFIEDMTSGGSDYGITIAGADTFCIWISSAVDTTDAANGIAFGLSQDTNLYRSAANTLRTDDALSVGGNLVVVGTGVTLGNIAYVVPADDGDAGEQLQTNGTGTLTWEAAASQRRYKVIRGEHSVADALDKILGTRVYDFRYDRAGGRSTGDWDTVYTGIVAEEAPWAMHFKNTILNPINALCYTVLAIQGVHAAHQSLETRVGRLERQLVAAGITPEE